MRGLKLFLKNPNAKEECMDAFLKYFIATFNTSCDTGKIDVIMQKFKDDITAIYPQIKDIEGMPKVQGEFDPMKYIVSCFAGDDGYNLTSVLVHKMVNISENLAMRLLNELLDAGLDINKKTPKGKENHTLHAPSLISALNIALGRYTESVKSDIALRIFHTLIERGANVNIAAGEGERTPLSIAIYYNKLELVKLLLNKRANANDAGNYGSTPLISAIRNRKNSLEIVRLLLDKGANANYVGNYGNTPLREAIYYNKLEIIKLLLERGADVNYSKEGDRSAPLMDAITRSSAEIIELLIKDKNLDLKKFGKVALRGVEQRGNTAISEEEKRKFGEMANFLRAQGVKYEFHEWLHFRYEDNKKNIDSAALVASVLLIGGFSICTAVFGILALETIIFAVSVAAVAAVTSYLVYRAYSAEFQVEGSPGREI